MPIVIPLYDKNRFYTFLAHLMIFPSTFQWIRVNYVPAPCNVVLVAIMVQSLLNQAPFDLKQVSDLWEIRSLMSCNIPDSKVYGANMLAPWTLLSGIQTVNVLDRKSVIPFTYTICAAECNSSDNGIAKYIMLLQETGSLLFITQYILTAHCSFPNEIKIRKHEIH